MIDSANRMQSKRKAEGFAFCSAEVQPILFEDTKNLCGRTHRF